jgi:hypothetical protein
MRTRDRENNIEVKTKRRGDKNNIKIYVRNI